MEIIRSGEWSYAQDRYSGPMHETTHIVCGPDDGTTQPRIVYPIHEVARRLQVTPRHVWRIANGGGFAVTSENGMSVVEAGDLARYQATRRAVKAA